MSKNDLLTFFDNLIEIGDNLFTPGVLRIISKNGKGIKIYTPLETFEIPQVSYDEIKNQIEETKKVLMSKTVLVKSKVVSLSDAPLPEDIGEAELPPTILQEVKYSAKRNRRITNVEIPIDNSALGSAKGQLPNNNLVKRKDIVIVSPGGAELGRGCQDNNGTIQGPGVSGFISMVGQYQLVFRDYSEVKAFISYTVVD